ncbi:MAG: nitroreductase [Ignavibacteria bacterium]|nr:MAG: nitroreductase [Ignavibacteria bacterium]KAF0160109.1 MAG: nitroreductase [Ignavibacteria bacterium]
MIKQAKTKHNVHELIRNRWSARSFSDKEITQDELETIFEAAGWTFSAMNYQPWRYIYAHQKDKVYFQKMVDCLSGGNKPWAKDASVIIMALAKKNYDNGTTNISALHDLGAANATLILQATAMNIYGHLMGGYDKEKAIELFDIDADEFEPVVFIALGYLDLPEKLIEPFKTREVTPRTRKDVSEFTKEFTSDNKESFFRE